MRSIIVVGGGTAGWLSAAYLHKALRGRGPFSVTVVESDDVGIIGVGEATIPSMRQTLRALEIAEWQFVKAADATFKNGIKFVDWKVRTGDGRPSSSYFHPFENAPVGMGHNAFVHYLALKEAGVGLPPMWDTIGVQSLLSERLLCTKLMNSPPFEAPVPYAYHLDAVKFGRMLRNISMARGVERIVDHVKDVRLSEGGDISYLVTRDGRHMHADFFIDCTGFSAVLIEGHLKEPFLSFDDVLLCDRAIAIQTPHPTSGRMLRPFTTSTAKTAGWTWEIDLINRRGTGYVFSSKYLSDEAAEEELLQHLGLSGRELQARVLEMRVGRRENIWVKNCLAVGLSGGFIEPLESTGIHFIELAIGLLVDHAPRGADWEPLRRSVNALYREAFDETADFVLLHYILNARTGLPFWDAYRQDVTLPTRLSDLLELWRIKLPTGNDLSNRARTFGPSNWTSILVGMDRAPALGGNLFPYVDLDASHSFIAELKKRQDTALAVSPPHAEILHKLRAVSPGPDTM